MYDEPHKASLNYEAYWASRPLDELLAKAQEFVGKTYSGSMSLITFFEWALEHVEPGSEKGANIADAMEKASTINRMLAELNQDVTKPIQEQDVDGQEE